MTDNTDVDLIDNLEDNLQIEDMSNKQIKKLKKLAIEFNKIEIIAREEISKQMPLLEKRVNDTNDWLIDFEVEMEISCSIGKKDKAYKENEDNFICHVPDSMLCQDVNRNWNESRDKSLFIKNTLNNKEI